MEKFYLYNTLTKRVDEFVPREAGKVSMYTCGPTVYRFAHIGNLRSYIMEDVLEKFLRYIGYDVKRVMNITDVGHLSSDGDTGEDKMVSGAKREGKTVMELAKFYENAFFDDCRKLNIKTPDVVEPATNCIAEYIKLIEKLFENGYAYEAGGNIYLTPPNSRIIISSRGIRRMTCLWVCAAMLKRTETSATSQTLCFGSQNPNSILRN